MDVVSIISLIDKGLGIANMLIEAGKSAKPAIDVLLGLTKSQQEGGVTAEQLNEFEAQLDALIEDFNKPMD